ncbi:hypothetical protein [Niastella caeni]|uniref:hypothetical protein n=1 Tax=Niastella caeni TaxID=2569763 RepID=UPI001AA02FF5|nr:hypothetical protein [Niastella caeni]
MLKTLPLSVILLLCISCSRYQYTTISSSGVTMNDKLEFFSENDSLLITYNFNGCNAPVNITIQNKLQVPVYIDWQRSALIVNDKAISYVPTEMKISGGFNSNSYNFGNRSNTYGTTTGSIHATASLPPSVDFIPPQSYLAKNPMAVTNRLIENVPDTAYRRVKYAAADGFVIPVKMARFNETNTPLRFRSYLTLMVGDSTTKPIAYEHSFYISELITTTEPPQSIWLTSAHRGNQYYIKEATGYGKAMAGFGVIAGTAVYVATVESMSQVGNNVGR